MHQRRSTHDFTRLPASKPLPIGGSSTGIGTWRSLVAHYTGGVGVAGSNPVVPTSGNFLKLSDDLALCPFEEQV